MIKHYRLLKDLPTFSAGDIFQLREDGCLYFERQSGETKHPELSSKHWKPEVMAYHKQTLAKFPNILKDWFEALDEPEERFYIDARGGVVSTFIKPSDYCAVERRKIGNDFETKEEAELAVRKLKAWKRLKDKGLEFERWTTFEKVTGKECFDKGVVRSYYAVVTFRSEDRLEKDKQIRKDLDLLFGDE